MHSIRGFAANGTSWPQPRTGQLRHQYRHVAGTPRDAGNPPQYVPFMGQLRPAVCEKGSMRRVARRSPGGATAPVLQQAHKSELSFCFLPYQNANQQRRRTRRQRTERREPWQGTLQDLFCNARQTEGGSATTCSVAAHIQHKILCFPDPHAREPRQGQSFPYRFQGSCHHLAPTTLHRPSTTSGRTAAIWQRRQQRMK